MITECNIKDLQKLADVAHEFYEEGEIPLKFDSNIFINNWTNLINAKIGVIFILINGGNIVGALGGVKYSDINSSEIIATEMFWFVRKEHRGKGIKLLNEFEKWTKSMGIKKLIMVHLSNLMSDKLKRFYKRIGYKEIEIHYLKELKEVN